MQCLDERVVQFIEANQKNKLKVYIIDKLPEKTTKGTELPEVFSKWVEIVTLDNLPKKLWQKVKSIGCVNLQLQITVRDNFRKPSGSSYDREPDRGRALRNAI